MRSFAAGLVSGVATLVICASALAVPAFAGVGGTTDDGDQPIVEKTVTDSSSRSGKTTTKQQPSRKQLEEYQKQRQAEQKRLKREFNECLDTAKSEKERQACIDWYSKASTAVTVDPRDIARQVIARLRLPGSTPMLGPDPSLNTFSPGDLVVNYPYWLSVPGDSTLSTTATADGLTLTLDARRTRTLFDMGNGDTVTCTTMLPWPGPKHELDKNGNPVESPVCGYHYTERGTRTITATVTWDVAWSGGGLSGIIRVTHSDSIRLNVIELHTVIR